MNDRRNLVDIWRELENRQDQIDTTITKCIDGKVLKNDKFLHIKDIGDKEREAILKGFMPDGYYSAFENMVSEEIAA